MKKIMQFILAGAVGSLLFLEACKDKNNELPKIDGYNNSDEVAHTNLVAHWAFNNTNTEAISNTNASVSKGKVGYTQGPLGQALNLDSGALVYPTIAAINDANSLNNYSVSMWVAFKNTKGGSNYFTPLFSLAPMSVSDIWPDIFLGAETSRHLPSSDTVELKALMNTHPASGKDQEDNIAQPNPNTGTPDSGTGAWFKKKGDWIHFVVTWDATNHQFKIYGDAVSVGGYSTRANTGVEILATPVQAIFGSLPSSDLGFSSAPTTQSWGPLAIAAIDDVRIYNTALTDTEITALYNLGTAGR